MLRDAKLQQVMSLYCLKRRILSLLKLLECKLLYPTEDLFRNWEQEEYQFCIESNPVSYWPVNRGETTREARGNIKFNVLPAVNVESDKRHDPLMIGFIDHVEGSSASAVGPSAPAPSP